MFVGLIQPLFDTRYVYIDIVGEVWMIQYPFQQDAFRFIPDLLSALLYCWLYFHRRSDLIR